MMQLEACVEEGRLEREELEREHLRCPAASRQPHQLAMHCSGAAVIRGMREQTEPVVVDDDVEAGAGLTGAQARDVEQNTAVADENHGWVVMRRCRVEPAQVSQRERRTGQWARGRRMRALPELPPRHLPRQELGWIRGATLEYGDPLEPLLQDGGHIVRHRRESRWGVI